MNHNVCNIYKEKVYHSVTVCTGAAFQIDYLVG